MRRRIPLILAAVALCLGALLLLPQDTREALGSGPDADRADPRRTATAVSVDGSDETAASPGEIGDPGTQGLPSTRTVALRTGRVEDTGGLPLAGARVTACPLHPQFDLFTWRGIHWAQVQAETIEMETAPDGSFSLPAEVSGPVGLVVTRPGFLGQIVGLDADEAHAEDLRFALAAVDPIRVIVTDGEGHAVAGAAVHSFAVVDKGDPKVNEWTRRARRITRLSSVTDEAGVALLPALEGEQDLRALHGTSVSETHRGPATPEIRLTLTAGFTLQGLVTGVEFPRESKVSVLLEDWVDGEFSAYTGHVSVRRNGTFGPGRFPIPDRGSGVCRLLGANLMADPVEFAYPAAGAEIHADFAASEGAILPLLVVDSNQEPIHRATAWGQFFVEPLETLAQYTNEKGAVDLLGLPENELIHVTVKAPGFATRNVLNIYLPWEDDEDRMVIDLARPATALVTVTRGGEPITDYTLMYWRDPSQSLTKKNVTGSEDGTYRIENLDPGSYGFSAYNPENSESVPAEINAEEGQEVRVALELNELMRGSGRVIDGNTYEGIEGAQVTAYTTVGSQLLSPWGPPSFTGPDGGFEVTGLAPHSANIYVTVEGYGNHPFVATSRPGQPYAFGDLPVYKPKPMTFELVGAGDRVTEYKIRAWGTGRTPVVGFDSSGIAILEGLRQGSVRFQLTRPDGSLTNFMRQLQEGETERVRFFVGEGTDLAITLTPQGDRSNAAWIYAHQEATAESRKLMLEIPESGEVLVEDLVGSRAVLEVRDQAGALLAVQEVELSSPGGIQEVDLVLEVKPTAQVRVVDPTGKPLEGVTVVLNPTPSCPYVASSSTDAEGLARIPVQPCDLKVMLNHPSHGTNYDLSLPSGGSPDVVHELVLDSRYTVTARLLDGNKPVAGVLARLQHLESSWVKPFRSPDPDGVVTWKNISEGTYHIRAAAPGYWLSAADVKARLVPGEPTDIQFRRTGALELRLEDTSGDPLSGWPVTLTPLDQPGDPAAWITQGRIEAPTGLTSNAQGIITLQGLPRGPYRVESSTTAGGTVKREVEVPAAATGTLELRL